MDEKKSIKVSLGTTICIFIIILLIVALGVVYYLGYVKNKQEISDLKNEIYVLKTKDSVVKDETEESETKEKNLANEIYGFACKTEGLNEDYKNTLVAINKNDNSEIPLINFDSGAYDYYDNKIYFYEDNAEELEYGFYMIDLNKDMRIEEIYLTRNRLPLVDYLEYYNGKIYYTAYDHDAKLFCLDIQNKHTEIIDNIDNYEFHVNKKYGLMYYTNDDKALVEMNLKTKEVSTICEKAVCRFNEEGKIIYETQNDYIEYDIENQKSKRIEGRSSYGTTGRMTMAIYNEKYYYINSDFKMIIQEDSGKKQIIPQECTAFVVLSNNKILLEKDESSMEDGEKYTTYIYDIDKKIVTPTGTNYRYSYFKKI